MTTEDDFQAKLDADPTDWQTRLVFSDWLQEIGDPRADGYRALGLLRRSPRHYPSYRHWTYWLKGSGWAGSELCATWWAALAGAIWKTAKDRSYETRRGADDAAALAFSELKPSFRRRLLKQR